ncbi:unnamed protein product [Echinostoma caproni]|uniref:rhomboid protease n=1 Tax=Echinostoma caproni TaxID=27848 RepID=A0A183AWG9_9TREM|nr:unnamed protein product [Echinostoma caproni]
MKNGDRDVQLAGPDTRTFSLWSAAKARIKSRSSPGAAVPHVAGPVSVKLLARCGLFTFVSVNAIFIGTVIWDFERWRRKTARAKERTTPALSMLLSVFSHHSLFHLGINMYVLHSFAASLIGTIGAGDFLALYVGGGVFSSFLSLLSKAARRSPVPSLGASGGICAVLGAFCMLQPHARLCVPFVVDLFPHSFEAKSAAWTLLMLEFGAAFLIASRSPIDHAAHMGGLLFGMYYGLSGSEAIWRRRTAIVSWWRQLRGE